MLREATQIYESHNFLQAASIIARERMRKRTLRIASCHLVDQTISSFTSKASALFTIKSWVCIRGGHGNKALFLECEKGEASEPRSEAQFKSY